MKHLARLAQLERRRKDARPRITTIEVIHHDDAGNVINTELFRVRNESD